MNTTTHTLTPSLDFTTLGAVDVTLTDRGEGRTFLLLHGGAGPQSVFGFGGLLASTKPARVFTPTHPGFGGTPRPASLTTVRGLAATYLALLDKLDLKDVTVVGNSLGGWIASEMALLGSPRLGRLILVNAVGILVPDHPVTDVSSLPLDQIAARSWHDPSLFRRMLASAPPPDPAVMAGNRASLALYGTPAMVDPTLRARLSAVKLPALVAWGESDRIVSTEYGRAFAGAIPDARFELLPQTGHVPQLETPEALLRTVWRFVAPATGA